MPFGYTNFLLFEMRTFTGHLSNSRGVSGLLQAVVLDGEFLPVGLLVLVVVNAPGITPSSVLRDCTPESDRCNAAVVA